MAGPRGARLRAGPIEHQVIWNQWGGGIENIFARSVTVMGAFFFCPVLDARGGLPLARGWGIERRGLATAPVAE